MPDSTDPRTLADCFTPCAVVDREKLEANIVRMNARLADFEVDLRPHVKTSKSVEIAKRLTAGHSGAITVSTLTEAEHFADAAFTDILYAVGIVPSKLPRVAGLLARGVNLQVVMDSAETARLVAEWGRRNNRRIPALLEINSDDHRAGLDPDDPEILAAATILHTAEGTIFRGVMTHAGASYDCDSVEAIRQLARQERNAAVAAADAIRAEGIPCDIVSVGSTPTALFATCLDGVTEVRAGVYAFFDLFQAGLGCCRPEDIALSVLTSIIGHKQSLNTVLTDAGGLALSKDRGTANQSVDRKYGLVCAADTGEIIENLLVASVNQEHGILSTADGSPLPFDRLPIGSQLRILPNHACMTAAAYDRYAVVDGIGPRVVGHWPRCGGW